MISTRVAIVGTGPASLAAASKLLSCSSSIQITIYEKGHLHSHRSCPVDYGRNCHGCRGVCNVTSGFGGCLHVDNAIKLSRFPSGRRLRSVLGMEYECFEREAMSFFETSPADYVEGSNPIGDILTPRQYPVAEVGESRLSSWITKTYKTLTRSCQIRLNTRVLGITATGREFEVISSKKRVINLDRFDVVLMASGRSGINDANDWFHSTGVKRSIGRPSIGIRIELPGDLLRPLYEMHRDFKFTDHRWSHKVKSFCFCGKPDMGGRIKYCHYQDQFIAGVVFIDGSTSIDGMHHSGYTGNFALLAQIATEGLSGRDWLNKVFIPCYIRASDGQPVWQPLSELVSDRNTLVDVRSSVACMRRGAVDSIIPRNILNDLIASYDLIARFAAQRSAFALEEYWDKAVVMAPVAEFAWDRVETISRLETSIPGLYVIGDSAGLAQGNLQAAIGGFAAASQIIDRL